MRINSVILEGAKKLYLEGNSIRRVAKLIQEKYGIRIGKETTRRYLSKVLKLRSKTEYLNLKRGCRLDPQKIVKLYTDDKLSLNDVARLFNASVGGIKWTLIKNDVKLRTKHEGSTLKIGKYEKRNFDGTDNEKAYLMGITLGDAHVRPTSSFTIEVGTTSTHKSLIDIFTNSFRKYTDGVIVSKDEKRGLRFCSYVNNTFGFLIEVKRNVEIIKDFNQNMFLSFLAGFFDAEGCIVKSKHRKKLRCVIKIGNTNKEILEIIKERLEELQLHPKIYLYSRPGKYHYQKGRKIINRKSYYMLEVCRKEEILQLLNRLELKHEEKINRKSWAIDYISPTNLSLYTGQGN